MPRFIFLNKDKIHRLPKETGIYLFKNRKMILYIGKATNIKERVKNHFQQSSYRDTLFINQAQKIGYIKTNSEIEALILESNLIKKYQPKYNVMWRDDKNYFYIEMTKEDFPRIFITHQPAKVFASQKFKRLRPKSTYIGPFVDGTALKQTLKILRKVFPYRSCKTLPKRPCLWYQLARCSGPCLTKSNLGKQIAVTPIKMKRECQRNAKLVLKVIQGKKLQVLTELKREMKKLSKLQDFERAAKIRNQIMALEKVLVNAKVFEAQELKEKDWNKIQKILQTILKVKTGISRIEAYDVSNIQGKEATGSMVTFIYGLPEKNFYRRFKIKTLDSPNDIAMIKEVLSRRLQHKEWPYPDLILIDGGKAQLNAAIEIKNQESRIKNKIRVVSLAKRKRELFVEDKRKPILIKILPREIFNLILQMRDEAHRFAISYHRKLRNIDLKRVS